MLRDIYLPMSDTKKRKYTVGSWSFWWMSQSTNDLFTYWILIYLQHTVVCRLSKRSVTELHPQLQINDWCDQFDLDFLTNLVMLLKKRKETTS